MYKFLLLSLLTASLCLGENAVAQKTKKAPAQKTISEDTPPEIERLEDVKIDAVQVQAPMLDTSNVPNDAHTAAIKQLLQQMEAVDLFIKTLEHVLREQKEANSDPIMQEFYARFAQTYNSNRVRGLIENLFVKLYRKHYTIAEIKELTFFYTTPLGKKTLAVTPSIVQESNSEGGKLGGMLAAEVMEQMKSTDN